MCATFIFIISYALIKKVLNKFPNTEIVLFNSNYAVALSFSMLFLYFLYTYKDKATVKISAVI